VYAVAYVDVSAKRCEGDPPLNHAQEHGVLSMRASARIIYIISVHERGRLLYQRCAATATEKGPVLSILRLVRVESEHLW